VCYTNTLCKFVIVKEKPEKAEKTDKPEEKEVTDGATGEATEKKKEEEEDEGWFSSWGLSSGISSLSSVAQKTTNMVQSTVSKLNTKT